ncbi:MAG: hypothetical protein AAF490_03160, partial [Chloroflexota bacterium]
RNLSVYLKRQLRMNVKTALEQFIVDEIMLADSGTKIDPDESLISNGTLDSLGLLRLIAIGQHNFVYNKLF